MVTGVIRNFKNAFENTISAFSTNSAKEYPNVLGLPVIDS